MPRDMEKNKRTGRLRVPLLSGECMWCDDGWPLDKWEKDHHYVHGDGQGFTVPCKVLFEQKKSETAYSIGGWEFDKSDDVGPKNKILPIAYGKHVVGKDKPMIIYDDVQDTPEGLLWIPAQDEPEQYNHYLTLQKPDGSIKYLGSEKKPDSGYIWGKGMEPLSDLQSLFFKIDKGTEDMKKATLGLFHAGFNETVPLPEIEVPTGGELMADSPVWINRFTVPSDSSDVEYVISQNRKGRWWACSCKGCKNNQHCKHLQRAGVPGDHEPFEARVAITANALPRTVLRAAPDAELPTMRPRRRFSLPDEDM